MKRIDFNLPNVKSNQTDMPGNELEIIATCNRLVAACDKLDILLKQMNDDIDRIIDKEKNRTNK